MDANNAWGGGGGRFANSFESAAESYSKATGEALVLRDVTINAYANPYGDGLIFTGEPYYDPDNWLHTRLDEKFIDYNAWFKKQTDEFQSMLDIAGSADPTGFIDGLNAVIYAGRGQMVNAGISALAIIPYIGDAAKAERIAAKSAGLSEDVAKTFRFGRYTEVTLDKPMVLSRYYDNVNAFAKGRFMTNSISGVAALDRMGMAIRPSWNGMTKVAHWEVPAGSIIYQGRAAMQFPWLGGKTQYFVPELGNIKRVIR